MPFTQTGIPGLVLYEPRVFHDHRGYFFEAYNQKDFADAGIDYAFIQDNQSVSSFGVIRGLHYQLDPHAQTKLVRVLSGIIYDVAVDLRKGSPTYGNVFGQELSDENGLQLIIPQGFAHGFSVLSEKATVLYKCDHLYHKESEAGICFNDPDLAIDWKVPVEQAVISEKDKILPSFRECQNNFNYQQS